MRRHFGTTIVLAMVVSAGGLWWAERTLGREGLAIAVILLALVLMPPMVSHAARQQGASASVWTMLTAWGATSSFVWIGAAVEARWYVKVILLGVVSGTLMSIANRAFRNDVRRAQRELDLRASELVGWVKDGRPVEPFALYLRPFVTTERLVAQPVADFGSGDDFPVHLDVETLLARALRQDLDLVGLGRPGEIEVGAGRVVSDEGEWRDIVQAMARKATLIVMVPLARPGTLEELRFLVTNELLPKTILLMPEAVGSPASGVVTTTERDRLFDAGFRRYTGSEHHLDLPAEWTAAIEAGRRIGVELPPQAGVGALFAIDPVSLGVGRIAPLALSSLSRRSRYLQQVLGWLGEPEASPARLVSILESSTFWRGRTLEYVLVRAADGYVVWGDVATARFLLRRAREEGRRHPRVASYFLNSLPDFVADSIALDDPEGARRYLEAAVVLWADERLAPLVESDARRRLQEASAGLAGDDE